MWRGICTMYSTCWYSSGQKPHIEEISITEFSDLKNQIVYLFIYLRISEKCMFRIKSSKSIVGEKSIEVHWSTLWKLLLIRICKPRILNLKLFCGHGNVHLQLSKERKFTEVSLCQTSGTLNLSKIWIFLHFSVFCFTPTSAVLNIQAQAERGSALFWATGI